MRKIFSMALATVAIVSPMQVGAVEFYKQPEPGAPCTTRAGTTYAPPGYCIARTPRPVSAPPADLMARRSAIAREGLRSQGLSRVGVIKQECLMSWSDSQQVHKVETRLEWTHQSVSTQMKKLDHCVQIELTGPVDVEGIAKGFVDHCVNYALNHRKVEYGLRAVGAAVVDVYGAGGGAYSGVNATDWANMVGNEAVGCLVDEGHIQQYFGQRLKAEFNARVNHRMEWVYWWV